MDKYCRRCGKKLEVVREVTEEKFDEDTGKGILINHIVTMCPDHIEGYSDRYYSFHDVRIDGNLVSSLYGFDTEH